MTFVCSAWWGTLWCMVGWEKREFKCRRTIQTNRFVLLNVHWLSERYILRRGFWGGSKHPMPFTDLKNWNCAIGYGVGSSSPLSPSFNFALELVRSSQLVASFYQHHISAKVLDYRGGDETLNYIDLGLELATRVDKDKPTDDAGNSSFQGKLGPSKSSAALAYKFPPFFTCSITDTKHLIESVRSWNNMR